MKRLHVRPQFRGNHAENGDSIGRALARLIVDLAREHGYRCLRLDTIGAKMEPAARLYRPMGFVAIAPYCQSPAPGTVYMELVL